MPNNKAGPLIALRNCWLENCLEEGVGVIFVTNFLPLPWLLFPYPSYPPGELCFLGSASRKTTSGLFFFPLSPVNKALSRVALNLLQIAKKWLKVSSSFCTLGAETQGSALAKVPNSLQTARKKKERNK